MSNEIYGNFDFPFEGFEFSGYSVRVSGWAFSTNGDKPKIHIFTNGKEVAIAEVGVLRLDVGVAYPSVKNANLSGFVHNVNQGFHDGLNTISVIVKSGNKEKLLGKTNFILHKNMFDKKQEKILHLLVCPDDKSQLEKHPDFLLCKHCKKTYPIQNRVPIMLSGTQFQYVSSNPYSSIAEEIIQRWSNGLVLNDGSGWPRKDFENVINLEITSLPSTNVVGDGSKLPFPDESFDAIISLSVVEHVEDPFAYAKEMYRVCKKGGEVLIDSAFMQPIHNYPQHYFNTTLEGLKLLFGDFKPIRCIIDEHQKPWVALQWFLKSYLGGLDSNSRDKFLNLKVSDLLNIFSTQGRDNEFSQLSKFATEELAAGVQFHGKKE